MDASAVAGGALELVDGPLVPATVDRVAVDVVVGFPGRPPPTTAGLVGGRISGSTGAPRGAHAPPADRLNPHRSVALGAAVQEDGPRW